MASIVTRLLSEDDIVNVNQLYQKAYGIERSTEKFKWEFLDGPEGAAIYVVAIDQETAQVIGTQCAIPLLMQNGQRTVLTAKSEDTLVDPAYRGQRVFEKMYELLFSECDKRGITAIWGFTYATKPFQKIGFEVPFISNFGVIAVRPLRTFRYLVGLRAGRSLMDRGKIFGLAIFSFLKYNSSGKERSTESHTISKSPFQNIVDLDKSTGNETFFLRSDEKFLGWRIGRNPYPNSHSYYSLLNGEGKQVACVISSVHAGDVAYIMHIVFDAALTADARKSFLGTVLKDVGQQVSLIRYWGFNNNPTGESLISLLKNCGFTFTGQGIPFVWKKMSGSLDAKNFVVSRLSAQGT